jgi:hypothetical protein
MLSNASLNLVIKCTSHLDRDLSKTDDPMSLSFIQNIGSGTGANQGDRIFHDTRTLGATSAEDLSMYDFGGAVDPVGQTYALARVILLIIQNKATTAGYTLKVGGKGTSTTWTSPFNTVNTDKLIVEPGGIICLYAGSAAGYAVANTTNHILKIDNANAASVDYNIVVIGSS